MKVGELKARLSVLNDDVEVCSARFRNFKPRGTFNGVSVLGVSVCADEIREKPVCVILVDG